MRWIAALAGAALLAGCSAFAPNTVECGGGFLCPENLACAAPGYCGEPGQVEKCRDADDWSDCSYAEDPTTPGTCLNWICEPCTPDREGCSVGWHVMTPPTDVQLWDIWVVDRANAFAVGDASVVLHYDGVAWRAVMTEPPIPTGLSLRKVWASSVDDVYVVTGEVTERNVLRIKNRTTLELVSIGANKVRAIWGTSADNVHAVDNDGVVHQYDGSSWRSVFTAPAALSQLHGASATRVLATGAGGTYVTLEGGNWSSGTFPTGIRGLWVAADEAFAVGPNRTLLRFDGQSWTSLVVTGVPTDILFHDVWGTGEEYYVVGQAGAVARSTDGMTWSAITTTNGTNELTAISGSTADDIYVVGTMGAIWHYTGK